jgi:DNA polymerase III sliding clamp (beta) subunit (PCNA family)
MKASNLIEALQLCRPSLLSLDFVPVLTHFCFTGKTVYAYNDSTAVVVDFPSGLNFLVHGETLLKLVSTFDPDKEVGFEPKAESVLIKCGKAKIELAKMNLSDRKDFAFSSPDIAPAHEFEIEDTFSIALTKALETVLNDAHRRALMGALLDVTSGKVNIYTSDNVCITWTEVKTEVKGKGRYLISKLFCDQLLALQGKLGNGKLALSDSWAIAYFDGVTLYGKNIPETPMRLDLIIGDLLQKCDERSWATNSSKLSSILQRASIISGESKSCTFSRTGKVLKVTAKGDKGELEETLELKTEGSQEIEVLIDPDVLKKALDHAEFFGITEKGLLAFGNSYVRGVATLGTRSE